MSAAEKLEARRRAFLKKGIPSMVSAHEFMGQASSTARLRTAQRFAA
jgi:hypothetical protein